MSTAVNNVIEQPDTVSSCQQQAVRQAALPSAVACMIRHMHMRLNACVLHF